MANGKEGNTMMSWNWSVIFIGNMIITTTSWLAVPSTAQGQRKGGVTVGAAGVTIIAGRVDEASANHHPRGDVDILISTNEEHNSDSASTTDINAKTLRARVQNHVAAQLKKLLLSASDRKQQQQQQDYHGDDLVGYEEQYQPPASDLNLHIIGAERVTSDYTDIIKIKQDGNLLELKIDVDSLPPELADFVLNHEDLLLQNEHLDHDHDDDDNHDESKSQRDDSNHNAHPTKDNGKLLLTSNDSIQVDETIKIVDDAPCPLGTYSVALTSEEKGGNRYDCIGLDCNDDDYIITRKNSDCVPCPEGTTTLRMGSTTCQVVTPEDLLGMIYDLASGDSWDDHHRNGWKSGIPVCEWAGVSCNSKGEINGFSFPAIGFPLFISDSELQ